jgi:hypothetical protein
LTLTAVDHNDGGPAAANCESATPVAVDHNDGRPAAADRESVTPTAVDHNDRRPAADCESVTPTAIDRNNAGPVAENAMAVDNPGLNVMPVVGLGAGVLFSSPANLITSNILPVPCAPATFDGKFFSFILSF